MSKLALLVAVPFVALVARAEVITLPGLEAEVELSIDRAGVPHLFAANDFDSARVQGFLHASDRFFQMDVTRREVSGDLAELLGPGSLGSDIQLRTVGLRRAAERSFAALAPRELALLQAYADGVNAWLATHPLPPEYQALELTRAREWTPVDSLAIGKGIAASLSLDIEVGPSADAPLAAFGLGTGSAAALEALFHLLSETPFDGVGASGVSFFPEPAALSSAADRRDVTLLAALGDALDALASDAFAPAFGGSTDLGAYRWGRLHRITFAHRLLPSFSVPPAASPGRSGVRSS